jgi:ribose 5-phosphate isomerase B
MVMTDEQRVREMVRRVVYRAVGRPIPEPQRTRDLVTGRDLEAVEPGGTFTVAANTLITPLARQAALERKIAFVDASADAPTPASNSPRQMTLQVAVGADHGGFELKQMLKAHLHARGFQVIDCGTGGTDPVDYPDIALLVAQLVSEGRAGRGILIDGAGIGSCMTANKVPGVRAAMCYDRPTAVNSRSHNDANVLTLGAGMIGRDVALEVVDVWLDTAAEAGRHARRVGKIMDVERRFLKKG